MKIEFFVYENANRSQALRELCLLMEKSYQAKETVFIQTGSTEDTELLDKLLWIYRDDSFLPHSTTENDTPILIGHQPSATSRHTLVNLTANLPPDYQQYQRVIEVVYQDAVAQQAARERFKQYRDLGQDIQTHKMKVSMA